MYLISSLFHSGYLQEIERSLIEIIALDCESYGAISGEIGICQYEAWEWAIILSEEELCFVQLPQEINYSIVCVFWG